MIDGCGLSHLYSGYNRQPDNGSAQIGPDPESNFYFPDKSHTEVATSTEAFAPMYEFLTGIASATTDVVPAEPDEVTVRGRFSPGVAGRRTAP